MKAFTAVPLVLAASVAAAPSPWMRDVLNALGPNAIFAKVGLWNTQQVLNVGQTVMQETAQKHTVLLESVRNATKTLTDHGREFVQRGRNLYERIAKPPHNSLNNYELRVTLNDQTSELASPTICDPDVKQHSGYLDISDDRHLFFWFFEARYEPESAPLMLWLNGGPGCSSSTGLLMELGPCLAKEDGEAHYNEWSWNTNFNIVFLDQPVDTGFSYKSGGGGVTNSHDAAEDVWAFLQLFLHRFPKYADKPLHVAAESYGGHYAPHIASVIHQQNQKYLQSTAPVPRHLNLESIILANGLTEPYTQMASVPDFACGPESKFPIYEPDSKECANLKSKVPTCQRLVNSCYTSGSRWSCVPASLYCNTQLFNRAIESGINPYDVRKKCVDQRSGLCYAEESWVENYLNRPDVKKAVGAEENVKFQGCNIGVARGFLFEGDGMKNSAVLLPELLDAGIRVLVYAGNADFMCNFIGNERWIDALEGHKQTDGFRKSRSREWRLLDGGNHAGRVRSSPSGNLTYVEVFSAGHMVPYDQPEAALDMIERWVLGLPLQD